MREFMRGWLLVAVVVLSAGPVMAVATSKPAEPKLPPGWLMGGTLMCPHCAGLAYPENLGTCQQCGANTASGAFKLCPAHALEQKKCGRCLKAFPPGPTPGLTLEIGWLRPGAPGGGPHLTSDTADTLPIWVTVTNTTKEPVTAAEYHVSGTRPEECETLIFLVTSGQGQCVLRNHISPRRRGVAPQPLKFEPGPATFERDLGRCESTSGKLPLGAYKVRAAVGWLVSNELALTIKAREGTGPPVTPGDPQAHAALKDLLEKWQTALSAGKYELALEYAKRIVAIDPKAGEKVLVATEAAMKQRRAPTP